MFLRIFLVVSMITLFLFSGNAFAQKGKITLAYQPVASGLWTGFIIKEKKFYEKYLPKDVSVVFEAHSSGPPINNAMIADKIDIGYLGDMPLVVNAQKGVSISGYDSKIVAITSRSYNFNRIFVSPDSPIKNPRELKGKTISTVRGSTAERFLVHVLKKENIDLKDVTILNQDPSQSVVMLQAKRIDAVCVWEPMGSLVEFQKIGKEIANGNQYQPFFYIGGVAVTGKFIKNSPDWLFKIMQAHVDADNFLMKNPKESAEIIAKEVGMPVEVTRKAIEVCVYEPQIGPKETAELQADVDFLVSQKMMDPVDIKKCIDTTFIDRALKAVGK